MKALIILGNQLFSPKILRQAITPKASRENAPLPVVFMREDRELCTHFRYHKLKIQFFLSAMREYRNELESDGFKVHYETLDSTKAKEGHDYLGSLRAFIVKNRVTSIDLFEVEDKFFEEKLFSMLKPLSVQTTVHTSPMFVTTRAQFKSYLENTRRPFMKTFYEQQRQRLKVLVDDKGKPIGGQWSFDEDNRQPLPKDYVAPKLTTHSHEPGQLGDTAISQDVAKTINTMFHDHPGTTDEIWLPTSRPLARQWLKTFLKERLKDFGPYEDALSKEHAFLNHSVLTPFLNTGLLTPQEVIHETLRTAEALKTPLNSLEGFIRQIIGWREFIRGIYQNFSEVQETTNHFKHNRLLTNAWYDGTTGIEPLDDVIKKTLKFGYAHHIERLMIVGSLMLLLEIEPREAHRWFMEMFIDSSDWVMGPNVYGMALFSDGGIFATKPYICGSNYYRKMGGYKKGDWQDSVDGLYWQFIDRHQSFFLKNPRLSMMARTSEKMAPEKKQRLFEAAAQIRNRLTQNPR